MYNFLLFGAAHGIGYALCKKLSLNHKVYAISFSSQLEQINENIYYQQCDVRDELSLKKSLEKVFDQASGIDFIIYNSGYLVKNDFHKQTNEEITLQMGVNFFGLSNALQIILANLKAESKTSIIYIGSMSGYQDSQKYAGLSYYGASKAAAQALIQSLASEYDHTNIRFNALALGAVDTEMLKKAHGNSLQSMHIDQASDYIMDFILTKSTQMNGQVIPFTAIS